MRFWKGARVMASGVVPAHASYFLAYEHLKKYFNVDNAELNFTSTLAIGSCTTFFHDFFITPADGKFKPLPFQINSTNKQTIYCIVNSDETEASIVQKFECLTVLQRHYKRRRAPRPIQIIPTNCRYEHSIHECCHLLQRKLENYRASLGETALLLLVLPVRRHSWRYRRTDD